MPFPSALNQVLPTTLACGSLIKLVLIPLSQSTHMKVLGLQPNLTITHVVPLGVVEDHLTIVLCLLQVGVLATLELDADIFEGQRAFDDFVVIWILPTIW